MTARKRARVERVKGRMGMRIRTAVLITVLDLLPVLLTLLTWVAPKVTASSIATPPHATVMYFVLLLLDWSQTC